MNGSELRIGVDFDNTIVSYDELIYRVAVEQGLIGTEEVLGKKEIRDRIRQRENGEIEWQQVQGIVYGPRMGEARLIEGVQEFFVRCRQRQVYRFIVSHKTEYARFDPTRTPLREAAFEWMAQKGFFADDGLGLCRSEVFFESTREEKVARIRQLGCTHFIDDLEEVFREEGFPLEVKKILFAPRGNGVLPEEVRLASSWQEITAYLCDGCG